MILSRANQALLIPHEQAVAMWAEAPTVARNGTVYSILPHDPITHIALRALEIDAPAPILYHYDWPSADGEKPFAIQKMTAALITGNRRSYVLNDMGTGKTRTSLWAWHYLFTQGVVGKLLIVAPLSTLSFVWMREIMLTLPQVKAVVLWGTNPAARLKLLATDANIYIINHAGVATIAKQLHDRTDIDCLVLDELAVYRNKSKRATQMQTFAQRFVWAWGMTGRPMPNAPTDVWGQCKILTPNTIPKVFTHAKTTLMMQVNSYRWVPRDGAIERAFSWMQPNVRFSLDDVVELPDAIYRTIDVELSAQQLYAYRKLSNDFAVMVAEKRIVAANAAVALGKLLQVSAGYVYSISPEYVTLDSKERQDTLLELIDQAPHKVIVFGPWLHLIDNLSKLFTENKIDHAVVHGNVSKREEIFNAFQDTTQYRVLLAHPACIHHGITLTAATTIIWYTPITSLEIYEQANARIRRVGQTHKQLFLHLQSTAVERKVYAMLRNKQRMQDEFLAMVQNATRLDGDNHHDRN
jgi:SNF2 family DNA or RNA helicase